MSMVLTGWKMGKRSYKVECVGGMKIGKWENPEKNTKDPDLVHHKYHSSGTGFEFGTAVMVSQRASD